MFKKSSAMEKFSEFLQKKALKIEKRFRFVISALVMGSLMLLSTFFLFDKALIFFSIVVRVGRFEDIKKVYQSMQSPQMSGNMLQCTDNAVDKQKRYSDYRADNKRYQ